jgi:hypothetical protein
MKNNMVFIASFFTLFAHPMEQESKWSITAYGTKISLYKGDMVRHYAYDKGTEEIVICTGRCQDRGQYQGLSWPRLPLGKCYKMGGLSFRLYEDNNTYVVMGLRSWDQFLKHKASDSVGARKGIHLRCMDEPWFYKKDDKGLYYERYNVTQWKRNEPMEKYYGDEAIQEYLEDVSLCYKILLNQEALAGNVKNIAISVLGTGFKYNENFFAPKERLSLSAVKAILEYIKSSPRAYSCIELFIEDSDFDVYKKALMEQCGLITKICLFLFAQKDSENIVALLPADLIRYIALLIADS